jgi:hypothetical protein
MRVKERFIESKTGNAWLCEDAVFVNDYFAAVIDGATSKTKALPDGSSTGRKASELLFHAFSSIPEDSGPRGMMDRLNQAIRDFYVSEGMLDKVSTEPACRLSATVIVYSGYHRKIFRVGDGTALIGDAPLAEGKAVDRLTSEVRAFYLESEIRRGKTIRELLERDTGREFILDLLKRQMLFQNSLSSSPYSYFVIDGFFPSDAPVEEYPVSEDVTDIVLSSDGYPVLLPTLAETERALARILRDDPLCFRAFKTTKGVYKGNLSYDDRTYLSIDVSKDIG